MISRRRKGYLERASGQHKAPKQRISTRPRVGGPPSSLSHDSKQVVEVVDRSAGASVQCIRNNKLLRHRAVDDQAGPD